jgi:hypothetical protein
MNTPATAEASCTVRAPLASTLAMLFPVLLFGGFALNDRIAHAGGQVPMLGMAALCALGLYATVIPRSVRVARGEVVLSGAFGSQRAPVRSIRQVKIDEMRSPRGGTSRTLVLELDPSRGGRPLRLALPVDAKPDADLARVFQAIAQQAAQVSFDHVTNRIRLGQHNWG